MASEDENSPARLVAAGWRVEHCWRAQKHPGRRGGGDCPCCDGEPWLLVLRDRKTHWPLDWRTLPADWRDELGR
jgi:hypothetical protein